MWDRFARRLPLSMSDAEAVRGKVNQLLEHQEEKFWAVEWTTKSLDTKGGREMVVKALSLVARNKRARIPWYEDVDLIDVNQLEGIAGEDAQPPEQHLLVPIEQVVAPGDRPAQSPLPLRQIPGSADEES